MVAVVRNEAIQRARDKTICRCGHRNVSHSYGADDGPQWREGSRIGLGVCGIDGCNCEAFTLASVADVLNTPELWTFDEDSEANLIAAEDLGIVSVNGTPALRDKYAHIQGLTHPFPDAEPATIDPREITGVFQEQFHQDALRWYLEGREGSYDSDVSFYGYRGPVVVDTPDGMFVLDGCHRWLAAREADQPFTCEVIRPRP